MRKVNLGDKVDMKSFRIGLDSLGMFASTLCMFHCLALPLLLAALPLWQASAGEAGQGVPEPLSTVDSGSAATLQRPVCESGLGSCSATENLGNEEAHHGSQTCCSTPNEDADHGSQGCCSTPTDFGIHLALLAAVAPLGVVAWGTGFKQHQQMHVLGLGLTGVLLLCGGLLFGNQLFGSRGEQIMTVTGSICMIWAHMSNRRHCRCCRNETESEDASLDSNTMV